ncbi:MAG: acyl carrier protein [Erysipelotrichaceae bacterium]|nr:acyl carrier protein [Erysipelotrichaceae bacterium]
MEELLEVLKEIRSDVDFEKEEKLVDDGIIDSFDIVSIISEISERFDVEITVDDILPENFNSATLIYALIERIKEEQ